MSEREWEARPVYVTYVCDKCEAGNMIPSAGMLLSDPPQFKHRCNKCGHEQVFPLRYPTIRYRFTDGWGNERPTDSAV